MRYKSEGRRGRPNGRYRSQTDITTIDYLSRILVKYNVDWDEFFNVFFDIENFQEYQFGEITFQCRLIERDYKIFLITKGWEVIAQFRVPEHLLKEKTNLIKEFTSRMAAIKNLAKEDKYKNYKIEDLRAGMKHIKLNAQVLQISNIMQIITRSGFYANLAIAQISDETGTINLTLFGTQINGITLHDLIQIENAHVAWFRGERQLRVGKRGKINVTNSTINNI